MRVVNFIPAEGKWYSGTFDVQLENGDSLTGWKVKSVNGKNYVHLPFLMQKSLLEQVESQMNGGSAIAPPNLDECPF